jgi:hypothetical protein
MSPGPLGPTSDMAMDGEVGKGANIQPSRKTVDNWLSSFWKRHFVLTLLPCLVVWIWVAIPFPVSDPYKDDPFPDIPNWPKKPGEGGMPLDVNFYFFLFWYVPHLVLGSES